MNNQNSSNSKEQAVHVSLSATARRLASYRGLNLLQLNQLIAFLHGQEALHSAATRALSHIEEALVAESEDHVIVFGAVEFFRRKLKKTMTDGSYTAELRFQNAPSVKLSLKACEIDLILPDTKECSIGSDYLKRLHRAKKYLQECQQETALLRSEVEQLLTAVRNSRLESQSYEKENFAEKILTYTHEAKNSHLLDAERCYELCKETMLNKASNINASLKASTRRHLRLLH